MFEARRFYWFLLHTSIRRLYAITINSIILFLSTWLYFWYMPLNRTIQKLTVSFSTDSVDVHTNVNITNEYSNDHAQQLSRVAVCAEHSGIHMKRMYVQNDHQINFEGKGSITQLISFFHLLEKEHRPFYCVQMNMYKDCTNLFTAQIQLSMHLK